MFKALAAGTLGAIGFGGMSAAGYTPGTETDIGLDGSAIRDMVTGGLTVGSFFLPALGPVANVLRSLNNNREVEKVVATTDEQLARESTQNERLATLESRVSALEKSRSTKTTKSKA